MRWLLIATALLGCTQTEAPPASKATPPKPSAPGSAQTYGPGEVPAALQPLVARGDDAIIELQKGLFTRLTKALNDGTPASAISVCQLEVPKLGAALATTSSLALGRTSHRLRNPSNAPRPWAAATVAASVGQKAADAKPLVVDLGDRVGLLRPIPTGPVCVTCHGAQESFDPQLRAALSEGYPNDQALAFAVGDLRGWFWAEVPKAPLAP